MISFLLGVVATILALFLAFMTAPLWMLLFVDLEFRWNPVWKKH